MGKLTNFFWRQRKEAAESIRKEKPPSQEKAGLGNAESGKKRTGLVNDGGKEKIYSQ
jgi:hypothetical protein